MESNQHIRCMSEEALFELLTLTCRVDGVGTKFYYNKAGHFHRIHGPAIIWIDGTERWYRDGDLHREDGPAVSWSEGDQYYYINDKLITKAEFIKWQIVHGIKPIE